MISKEQSQFDMDFSFLVLLRKVCLMNCRIAYFFCFSFCCLSFQVNAQYIYSFDRLLVYNYSNSKDSINSKEEFVLANSKDNGYYVQMIEKDSLTYKFFFRDNDKLNFETEIGKTDFFKAESISTNCDGVSSWDNDKLRLDNERVIKKLVIEQISDTVHKSHRLKTFRVKAKKRNKESNNSYRYYFVDDSIKSEQPVIVVPSDYILWKKANIPEVGTILEFGIYDADDNIYFRRRLVSMIEIDKKVIVPNDCLPKVDVIMIKNEP